MIVVKVIGVLGELGQVRVVYLFKVLSCVYFRGVKLLARVQLFEERFGSVRQVRGSDQKNSSDEFHSRVP